MNTIEPMINLAVARSCFVICEGCYNRFSKSKTLVLKDEILSFLSYAKENGITKTTYCGGDPLSRPDIVTLLRETRRLGYKIKLDTVGTPLLGNTSTVFYGRRAVKKVAVEEIRDLIYLFAIPLDGASQGSVEHFRKGRTGLFEEQQEVIRLLVNNGCKTVVHTVATKHNLDELTRIGDIISAISKK